MDLKKTFSDLSLKNKGLYYRLSIIFSLGRTATTSLSAPTSRQWPCSRISSRPASGMPTQCGRLSTS